MLTRTIEWSLEYRWVVLMATAVLVVAGVLSFRALPIDAFPDTTPVQVQVNAVAPALTPIEIERQLTMPVEQVLAGLPHVEELRSISKFGLSQVTVRFSDDTNLWFARQVVAERLGNVELPPGVDRPTLGPVATGLGEIFHYLVRSKSKTLEELRTLHDWVIAPQLRSVSGVAEVNAWGGDEKQWHVVVDPRRLAKFDLSLADLYEALERNNANVGGGVVESGGTASLVLGVGVLDGPTAIENVVVAARDGVPILVRDVATVEVGSEIRRGATTADGEGEVVLGLGFMLVGENSHTVTKALAIRLDEVAKRLPPDVELEVVYERTELVDLVLRTVRTNLLEGALLVVAVLFVFLGNVRAGLIVAAAIPLAMLFAFSAMLRFGIAGTLMSLGAIDFGLIVDSSVILVENAERRLAAAVDKRSVLEIVRDAAVEVRKPTLFGELIIMIVYLPILALEGVEGKLFRPMALTVIFALLGSALISMTLMPVLASLTLWRGASGRERREPRLVSFLKRRYSPVLDWSLAHPGAVLTAASAIVIAAGLAGTRLGSEFVPRLSEGTLVINTVRLAEVSLSESIRYGTQIEKVVLAKFPDEVARVWTRTGTAEIATDPMGIELSDVFIALKPREEWRRAATQEELANEIKAELADMPGMRMAFLQPIEMRVNEMIAGVRTDLGIKIFGDDLDILKATAREVEALVKAIPGAADVTVEQVTGQPVLEVTVDRAAISRYGVPAHAVLDVVAAVGTRTVGEVREGERRFDLAVRLPAEYRGDPAKLATVLVDSPSGERIPLGRLANIREVVGPTTIQREWGKRRLVVQANVRGRDLGSFVGEVRRTLDEKVALPTGYYFRYGGQFENLERARQRLLIVVPMALALIMVLLYVTYRRVVDALRIFAGVPFAMVGGVLALLLRDLPFSISAAVGFIALSGVSVLGDMVLVSRVRQLLDGGTPLRAAIRDAAISRLRPVLMTAAVAALGFVPMALNTGVGAEIQRPLATVVIGGIISSTLLTLVVLPVLYSVFGAQQSPEVTLGASTTTRLDREKPVLGVAILMLCIGVFSAHAAHAEQVSLERALEEARDRNPDLLAFRQEAEIARSRLQKAGYWNQFNPTIEGGAGQRRFDEGGTAVQPLGSVALEVEVAGQRGKRIEEAERNLRRVEAEIRNAERILTADVKGAFYRCLYLDRRVELVRRVEELNRRLRDASAERFRRGEVAKLETNLAIVRYSQARKEVLTAAADYQNGVRAIERLLGREPLGAIALDGDLSVRPLDASLSTLLETARENRPDLHARDAEIKRVDAEAALNRRLVVPNPTFKGFYDPETEIPGSRDQIFGGSVTIPLPLFDQRQAERSALAARRAQATLDRSATALAVETEVRDAYRTYQAALEAIGVFESDAVERIGENFRLIETSYQAGKVDLLQLIVVENDIVATEFSYLESLFAYSEARVRLERAVGDLPEGAGK